MFNRIKTWWKWFTYIDPSKETINMTDQQLKDELSALWDKYRVFSQFMTSSEYFRMELIKDALDGRGYDIFGGATGISFERRTK